jgi:hypothetical protein
MMRHTEIKSHLTPSLRKQFNQEACYKVGRVKRVAQTSAAVSDSFGFANFGQMINRKLYAQIFSLVPNQELLVSTA